MFLSRSEVLSSRTIALGAFFLFMPLFDRTAPQCIGAWHTRHLEAQVVIHRHRGLLLRPKVAFSGLDRGVTEQELDLFQIAAVLAAELGAGPAQIVRAEPLDADLLGRLLDHGPHRPVAQARAHDLATLQDRSE